MMKAMFLKDQRGQSLVELALVLPLLLVLLAGVLEFGRIFHDYLIITNASREGARVAVLGSDDSAINDRVSLVTPGLDSTRLQTNITPEPAGRKSGTLTTVEVRYSIPLIFPIIDVVIPNPFTISARTTMRVE